MKEQASDAIGAPSFLPNVCALCECGLERFPANEFPICSFFEAVEEDDAYDCCKACRHSAACHLKGRAPAQPQEQERV
jgi:hypothetical protein